MKHNHIPVICFSLIILFFIITAPVFANSTNIPFEIPYSSYDYQFGVSLSNILEKLSKNQIDNKEVIGLGIKLNKIKIKIFPQVEKLLLRINLLSKVNNLEKFYKSCSLITIDLTPFENYVITSIDHYCRNLYLNLLTQKSLSSKLTVRDLNYFRSAAKFYITGENQDVLIKLLKKLKKNTSQLEKLSEIIVEQSIMLKIRPRSDLIAHLSKSAQKNSFLTKSINADKRSLNIFQDQYIRTSNEISAAIKLKDFVTAIRLADNNHHFFEKNNTFITPLIAWSELTVLAQDLFHKGREEEARKYFILAKSIAPKERKHEATFNLVWGNVISRDDKALLRTIQKHNLDKTFFQHEPKLQYWIAYAFYKNGEQKKAFELFNDIISKTPYSFYSILSWKILAQNEKDKTDQEMIDKLVQSKNIVEFPIKKLRDEFQYSLIRLSIWLQVKNEEMIENEINFIQSLPKDKVFKDRLFAKTVTSLQYNDYLTLNLIKLLNSKHQYLSSFKFFSQSLSKNPLALNDKVIKYLFPFKYYKIIKNNTNELDPLVVISLIRQESSFNPLATSNVGAKGLMQLMPNTAKRFNRKTNKKLLANPPNNINIGIKYLNKLNYRFDGNLVLVLASYNAGENRIDKWRKEIFKVEDPLAMIEAIPYKETRNYVKLIYRNYFFYSLLSKKSIQAITKSTL